MLRLAPLIVRNVLRNRRRSLLTLASTAVSLALLSLMLGLYYNMFLSGNVSEAQGFRVICRHKVSLVQPLPESYLQPIRATEGVTDVSPYTWFQGKYKDNQPFFARFGCDANTIFNIYSDFKVPDDQLANFKRERTGCAIAQKIADSFKLKVGDRIQIVGDIYPVTLELIVSAIFTCPPETDVLLFHQEYLTELLSPNSTQRNFVGTYMIRCKSAADVPLVQSAIDDMTANSPYPTHTESEKEFQRSFVAFMGNIQLFLAVICGAVTFTLLLVSANTVAMAVRERTREVAILRTLGYTPSEILQLVIGEAVLISIIGGLVGVGIARLLQVAMEQMPATFSLPKIVPGVAAIVLGMAAVVGLLAAIVPAFSTSRRNIVSSLRYTG